MPLPKAGAGTRPCARTPGGDGGGVKPSLRARPAGSCAGASGAVASEGPPRGRPCTTPLPLPARAGPGHGGQNDGEGRAVPALGRGDEGWRAWRPARPRASPGRHSLHKGIPLRAPAISSPTPGGRPSGPAAPPGKAQRSTRTRGSA